MANYNIANLGCVIIPMHQYIIGMLVAVYVLNYDLPQFGSQIVYVYVYLED